MPFTIWNLVTVWCPRGYRFLRCQTKDHMKCSCHLSLLWSWHHELMVSLHVFCLLFISVKWIARRVNIVTLLIHIHCGTERQDWTILIQQTSLYMHLHVNIYSKWKWCWNFPDCPVLKNLCSQWRGPGVQSLLTDLDSTFHKRGGRSGCATTKTQSKQVNKNAKKRNVGIFAT